MLALVFGDLHGAIRAMYERAAAWTRQEGKDVELLIQVGDLGVYPAPHRQEPDKIRQYGPGDYAKLAAEDWRAPLPTYFCKGNNEDFEALEGPLLDGLHYVPDGSVITLGSTRIGFIGGAWSRKTYEGLQFKPKHVPREGVERLYEQDFDVLISHEAPGGTRFPGRVYAMGAPPLRKLIEDKQPRLMIHGHHHQALEWEIGRTKVISLCRFAPRGPLTQCVYALEV